MIKTSKKEIVDLLNTNKNNLSALKDTNIIIEYFKTLGAKMWIKETSTNIDIILTEMERLLKYYNYNCQFTESGIFVGTERILGYQDNIWWRKGENLTKFGAAGYYTTDTIGCNKWITDFTDLSESEKSNLSDWALGQVQHPKNNCDMSLKKITIFNTVTSGVEVSKKVMESYESKENNEDWMDIDTTIAYSPNKPTINCEIESIISTHLQSHLDEYMINNHVGYSDSPCIVLSQRMEQPNYGTLSLRIQEKLKMEYDYQQLYINLIKYHQAHPLDTHPIFIYAQKYPEFLKKYLQELSGDFDFYAKMITSSTSPENISTLIEAFRQYRLTNPYKIHPRFFEIAKWKKKRGIYISEVNAEKEITEEHFKSLCLKK